ncbi:DUF6318 family protein [Cellulomonas soli]|uniref:DUF6318 domain-containing protein n=1 Tax=Cellulomonas soli TaxID=931535 RepID=A0A512PDD1_9CELL|nr:DUF6318 family protein [Cellulomonas soli]NYI60132.1 hypothetical protein [Cellulomonas soli]GEP69215.1 hypothetical protein CSO01_19300 [Cellulomonas soli]
MSIHDGGGPGVGERHGQRRAAASRSRVAGARIAAALALAAALTSCTANADDSPSPTTAPTVSASATPVASATPTSDGGFLADGVKPERPAALDEGPSIDGAIAASTYYLALVPYAQNTGDLADALLLSHADCVFCSGFIGAVEEANTSGGHSEGGAITISDTSGTEIDLGRWFSVHLRLTQQPSRDLSADGSVIADFPETKTYETDLAVIFESGGWSIREVSLEQVPE